jgi:hypothetical protein
MHGETVEKKSTIFKSVDVRNDVAGKTYLNQRWKKNAANIRSN